MTELLDPTQMTINPGLGSLPRQIGLFPNFRLALLAAAGRQAALKDWRGRAGDDYGVMLLEMWAYVSDVLAFYDKLIADESYLRTASQRAAVQRLVALLGYLPRPAVASMVDLALEVQGRRPVVIPAGTAFRSAAFEDEPPQVFETAQDVTLHPFYNRASIDAPRAATIGSGTGTQSFSALVFKPGTVTLRKGNVTLLRTTGNPAVTRITAVENIVDAAGSRLTEVSFSPAVSLSASTLPEAVDVTRATQTGS